MSSKHEQVGLVVEDRPTELSCGETGFHTLLGVNYTAVQWFTLVHGA